MVSVYGRFTPSYKMTKYSSYQLKIISFLRLPVNTVRWAGPTLLRTATSSSSSSTRAPDSRPPRRSKHVFPATTTTTNVQGINPSILPDSFFIFLFKFFQMKHIYVNSLCFDCNRLMFIIFVHLQTIYRGKINIISR